MITKEQFKKVYNKHLPNTWTKLAFRYFSTNTVKKDLWLKKIIQGVLIGLFLLGFIGTAFGIEYIFVAISTIAFTSILVTLGIFMVGAFIVNNLRIRKIRKKLDISKEEYEKLIDSYES
jgi:hypothetical protein